MVNSSLIFLAFIGFLLFGYISLVRLLANRHLSDHSQPAPLMTKWLHLARNLGSSAFFVSLPATAILLFWGWGPALIWLVFFHFFVESTYHLQFSAQMNSGMAESSIADHMLRAHQNGKAFVEQGLIQLFFLMSMAVIVALLATLIDRQPGLLFAVLFLIPARQLLSHRSQAIAMPIKVIGAGIMLSIGLIFSDQLGFSVYGDWMPFGDTVPWMVFNMPTLIAGFIVVAVFQLETNQGFKKDLSLLAGLVFVALVVAMTVKIVYLQPTLDAPINTGGQSTGADSLPLFISFAFFLFAGFSALLIRLLNEEENHDEDARRVFRRLQIGSTVHNIFMCLLVLSLGAALGIGAWKTHFLVWSDSENMLDYLNLAISSTLNLIHSNADSSTLLHTILLAALCFTGFSFLLMCAQQLTLEEAEKETSVSLVIEAKLPQALAIFIASVFFIGSGISLNIWLLIGILAWVLFCQLAIGMTLNASNARLFGITTMIMIVLGLLQCLMLIFLWIKQSQYLSVLVTTVILLCAAYIWIADIRSIIRRLSKREKVTLFN